MIENFSVTDIERILVDIKAHELNIDDAKQIHDQAVEYFQSLIANADKIFDDATKDDREEIAILTEKLRQYFDENPPQGRKSHKFAAGSFGYNKASTKFFLNGVEVNANNQELLDICRNTHDGKNFIKVKETLNWAALKKALNFDDPNNIFLEDTGEIINGLRAQRTFTVKTA